MRHIRFTLIAALLAIALPAAGAETGDPLKTLVETIDGLIRKAEAERTASQPFLDDLKAAIKPHQAFWNVRAIDETFKDGDFTKDPTWTAVSGRFEASKAGLLMSPRQNVQSQQAAAQLLNSLLGNPAAPATQGAVIALDQKIPNVFLLDVILRAADLRDARQAAMRIGVTQGPERRNGYWVAVEPGDTPTAGLYVISRSGLRRLGVAALDRDLLAGDDIRIQLQRREKGLIRVYVDKAKLIEATDETYGAQFDGVVLTSDGMDATVRRVQGFTHD